MNAIKFAYIPFTAVSAVSRGFTVNPKVTALIIMLIIIGLYVYTNRAEEENIPG
jgi:hypothetical protein